MSPRLVLPTRVGRIVDGDHEHFGRRVEAEMVGRETYTSMMTLAVSGRPLPPEHRALLDDLTVIHTAADPRVWPLKITRVVAAYGNAYAAFAAGQLCMEGTRIGPPIARHAALLIAELREAVGDRFTDRSFVEEEAARILASRKRLVGFGVPFRAEDERYLALAAAVERHGRGHLPHWSVQLVLSDLVRRQRNLSPNIGTGTASIALDMGFLPDEIGHLATFLNQNVFVANAVEGAAQAPALLRRLPDEAIEYVGPQRRKSPRAASA